ncbi:hypothetical protein HELRODRAFT_166986 [Helobdella robusta]|uniref:Uncharacterized protein n=1 Tax=Helobdella robusta TaxID=6412 RepID=T1EYU6_HELRO|nr:hypothetical protein HELRODRAFT_166986 [Helobdella robusta]ESO11896.1 hypothetical protein HELRODRAFT_166986 [Helobdella robusta]
MKCLEADYEMLSSKLAETTHKFEETVKSADESEKQRRILDHKKDIEDERLATLEKFIRETSDAAVESEKKCDEIIKKLAVTDSDSELAHQRYDIAEKKSKELQAEIKSIASKLKAMQSKLENADELEDKYERTIDDLRARLRNIANTNSAYAGDLLKKKIHFCRIFHIVVFYLSFQIRVSELEYFKGPEYPTLENVY